MHIVVFHSPTFGHEIEISTQKQGEAPYVEATPNWKGLGVPEAVLNSACGAVHALLSEHLVTRYGVAGELPFKWSGEPDPF